MSTLIEQILEGDAQAVRKLYQLYSPKIHKYLKYKLPKHEDAQEVLNDVFFEAIDSLALLKKEANISAWLYKIAHNKVVDFYRKRKIKSLLFSQIPFLEIVADEINQPEFQFEKDKIRDRIEDAFRCLSKRYQQILSLHYEQRIPVKELALIFDLSFKATESLLFRARQSFIKAYVLTEA